MTTVGTPLEGAKPIRTTEINMIAYGIGIKMPARHMANPIPASYPTALGKYLHDEMQQTSVLRKP